MLFAHIFLSVLQRTQIPFCFSLFLEGSTIQDFDKSISFRFQLRYHLLEEAFYDHPIKIGLTPSPHHSH